MTSCGWGCEGVSQSSQRLTGEAFTPPQERQAAAGERTDKRGSAGVYSGGGGVRLGECERRGRTVCFNAAERRGRVCIHGYL